MSIQATHGTPPLELIENAVHWLRRVPLTAHLAFLAGTVPFLLGLLFFWSDMSRGALADRRCAGAALLVSGLYLWMKSWHAVYCAVLRTHMTGAPTRPWTLRRWLRVLAVQSAFQPWGLLLFPLSILPLLLPLPWVFACFRHIDALADDADGRASLVLRSALRETKRWPAQNHGLIGLFLIAGTVVLINIAVVLSQLPGIIKMLTGLESDFTLSTSALVLNSTFMLATVAVSYVVLMPLVLAVYVRRSFEGASLLDGADLRAEFSRLRRAPAALNLVLAGLLLGFAGVTSFRASAQELPPRPAAPTSLMEAPALDRAIQDVLNRPDFTWRERREFGADNATLDPNAGWWERFGRRLVRQFEALGNAVKSPVQAIGRAVLAFIQWLFGGRSAASVAAGDDEVDWMTGFKIVLYASLAIAAVWLGWYGGRIWQSRRPGVVAAVEPALPAAPDLTSDHVSAAALPEEGWLRLARELAAKGEFRLAIRAVYLAELSYLGQRELVRLAEAKSNRDYQRELDRRARALPLVREAFAATVLAFDRVWYGRHDATAEALASAEARFMELRSVEGTPTQSA